MIDMHGKLVFWAIFTILVVMLGVAVRVQKVKASGTIYIRTDGRVDPPSALISTLDNVTYIFNDNINEPIVVERDDITIDGASYALLGPGGYDSKGILLTDRHNVTIKNVTVTTFGYGIWLSGSSNNIISENNVTANNANGIFLQSSSNNSISWNNITAYRGDGIWLISSSNNRINGNKLTQSHAIGIKFLTSSNNDISGNNITAYNYYGIELSQSNHNSVNRNNITNSGTGLYLESSSSNTINENNIANNTFFIQLLNNSSNNSVYHNNFINSTYARVSTDSSNVFDDDYPSGGNYWNRYDGKDVKTGPFQNETGSDGLSDTPYSFDESNVDRFPLMGLFSTFDAGLWNGLTYKIDIVSNSTITTFHFNPSEGAFLRFSVTGENGTIGFCRVTIPKDLLTVENGCTVLVGYEEVNYTLISNENLTYLYFTYDQSTKTVYVIGTHVIPEFPSALMLLLFISATIIAVALFRKAHLLSDCTLHVFIKPRQRQNSK